MRVYISGPISDNEPDVVYRRLIAFDKAEHLLKEAGFVNIYNAARPEDPCIGQACESGLVMPKTGEYQHTWECYMRHHIRELVNCDAICFLPDFEESRGALLEYRIADDLGIKKLYLSKDGVLSE